MYCHGCHQLSRAIVLRGWRRSGTRMDTGFRAKAHQFARKVQLPEGDEKAASVFTGSRCCLCQRVGRRVQRKRIGWGQAQGVGDSARLR